ncbi:uncharacterized protein LOC143020612 [Oratosquilla oratoria]|uniref:uncharacterized protein LOC143020612 n=1 Tax=Oratosquilla oratoria TaxID=337810 RepID=UPI003F764F60
MISPTTCCPLLPPPESQRSSRYHCEPKSSLFPFQLFSNSSSFWNAWRTLINLSASKTGTIPSTCRWTPKRCSVRDTLNRDVWTSASKTTYSICATVIPRICLSTT